MTERDTGPPRPILTLTTDYGHHDAFVGALKGVILSRCPNAQLVDLCHEVPPQDVYAGALRLASGASYFPQGTVHIAVIDPGVGGPRRPIAVASNGQLFVGPDNGVLSLAAPSSRAGWRAVELTRRERWLPRVSRTFHGRDVFAPCAAYLAGGGQLSDLGEPISSVVELELPRVRRERDTLVGVVIDVDRFGNLVVNVRETDPDGAEIETVEVSGRQVRGLSTHYDPDRPLVALFNGEGWLEIARPGGNAAALCGADRDTTVVVRLRDGPRP